MSMKKDDRASQKNPEMSPEPSALNEGVFNRPNFAKTVTSLIGNNVKVKTKKGSTYEGIFSSLSSDFDIVVDLSHEIDEDDPFRERVDKSAIVFKPEDIVSISCVNVNLKEALNMSQRMDFPGDFSLKSDATWIDTSQNSEPYDEGWNELLRSHKGSLGNSDARTSSIYSHSSSIYAHSNVSQVGETADDSFDDINKKYRGDPKPQRKIQPDEGSILEDFPGAPVTQQTSNLNPYAKPFTPMEKDSPIPLATVVLPTYVVPGNSPPKPDVGQHMSGGGAAPLLGGGSLHNHYVQYPYDYDEKLYSSYDSLPISAHDYQQYYPHLQYIQYFRRFY